MKKQCGGIYFIVFFIILMIAVPAIAADKPNILIIWGDDVGMWNRG